jgi:toxin ParE1/3/4
VKLRYTLPALIELDFILNYIAERSPQGAANVKARIKAVAGLLLTHPHIGVATDDATIRRVTANPYPYLILYEPRDDEIIIHSIRHGARKGN